MSSVDPHGFMAGKLPLSEPYNAPTPGQLLEVYRGLDYCIPDQVEHFVARLLDTMREQHGIQRVRVADIGCSFGFTAMLLQQGKSYSEITPSATAAWFDDPSLAPHAATGPSGVEVFGTDTSSSAIEYCRRTNVQRWSWRGDLETEELPPGYQEVAAGVNVVFSSGAFGYITERSACRLLQHVTDLDNVWVANFALTPLSYASCATAFARYGLVTEASPVLFAHRRFSSGAERTRAIESLRKAGLSSAAEEQHGYLFVRFYLSRPARTATIPLDEFWRREAAAHDRSTVLPDPERPVFAAAGIERR